MKFDWSNGHRRIVAETAWKKWQIENGPKIHAAIVIETPVDTGQMRNSVSVYTSGEKMELGLPVLRAEVSTDYAIIIHEGRKEVRPVHAKVLRWFDKISGRPVFAMKSRAVLPNRFILRALSQLGLKTKGKTG